LVTSTNCSCAAAKTRHEDFAPIAAAARQHSGECVKKPVLFLLGPTAAGKTALACALADQFPVELVSVDSALVYRDMDIGTAKPDAATQARYPHHLIDLIEPSASFSVADYRAAALAVITQIHARGKLPLLVGGTMMYANVLRHGLSALPPADATVRAAIASEAVAEGWPAVHAALAKVDAETAARLSPNDSQRIQRALEVFRLTGVPLSSLQRHKTRGDGLADDSSVFPFATHLIGLDAAERTKLHERIETRFQVMLGQGFVGEVEALRARHALDAQMPSMRAVGYRQVWQYLDGSINESEMIAQGIAATRQLAKRQMTWLRAMPDALMFDCFDAALAEKLHADVAAWLGATEFG
jgi:tRNA dimethylallyltransferase